MAVGGVVLLSVGWLGALSICDIRDRRLPNALTLPGAGLILLTAAADGRGAPALAGAAALAGTYLLVHLASPSALGAGDVKLAIGCGGLAGAFGADAWLLAALAAPLLTALVGAVGLVRGVRTVPHGPSMCVATAAAVGLAAI